MLPLKLRTVLVSGASQLENRRSTEPGEEWDETNIHQARTLSSESFERQQRQATNPKESRNQFFISRRRWIIFSILLLPLESRARFRFLSHIFVPCIFFENYFIFERLLLGEKQRKGMKREEKNEKNNQKSWNGVITYDQCDYNHTNFYGVEFCRGEEHFGGEVRCDASVWLRDLSGWGVVL